MSRRTSETSLGKWLGRAQKGSLWLGYAGPSIEKQKTSRESAKTEADSLEEEQFGKLGEEKKSQ